MKYYNPTSNLEVLKAAEWEAYQGKLGKELHKDHGYDGSYNYYRMTGDPSVIAQKKAEWKQRFDDITRLMNERKAVR